jgi:hypothetical protein
MRYKNYHINLILFVYWQIYLTSFSQLTEIEGEIHNYDDENV